MVNVVVRITITVEIKFVVMVGVAIKGEIRTVVGIKNRITIVFAFVFVADVRVKSRVENEIDNSPKTRRTRFG